MLHDFGGKRLYVVHINAFDEDFNSITDEEIVKKYEEDSTYIDCYDSIEEVIGYWNTEEFFNPSNSYMRLI